MHAGCDGEHAVSMQRLLGEEDASVNLVAEGEYESEEWWVGTVRIEEGEEEEEEGEKEEEETMVEIEGSESERETWHGTSNLMRKDNSRLEDELEYYWEVHNPSDPYEREEDRWWSPRPPESCSEEDEEEIRYLTEVLGLELQEDKAKGGSPLLQRGWSRAWWLPIGRHHMPSMAKSHQGLP
jgi:hypothetical protein